MARLPFLQKDYCHNYNTFKVHLPSTIADDLPQFSRCYNYAQMSDLMFCWNFHKKGMFFVPELTIGQKASRSITLTMEHVQKFAEITGDYNPLHFDESFAAGTPYGRPIVQGGLTTGLLHALVAMDMPGHGTVFLSQNWKFTAPVFIGDTITAVAEVAEVHATKPVTKLNIQMTRGDGEVVLEGEAWCYTFTPRQQDNG
jgi:acyl dehydratase